MFQAIAIGILIVHSKLPNPKLYLDIGTYILYFAVFLTVYSGVEYVVKYSKSVAAKGN